LVADEDAHGKVFNLGISDPVTIGALAHKVVAATESTSEIVYVPYEQAHYPGFQDVERRVPDCTRARKQVGFSPTRNLDDIIRDIVEGSRIDVAIGLTGQVDRASATLAKERT
jgi:UDP-glucose 4-epimerase